MSNNNASSNLVVAKKVVKQLRLEASVRRIKVSGQFVVKHGKPIFLLLLKTGDQVTDCLMSCVSKSKLFDTKSATLLQFLVAY